MRCAGAPHPDAPHLGPFFRAPPDGLAFAAEGVADEDASPSRAFSRGAFGSAWALAPGRTMEVPAMSATCSGVLRGDGRMSSRVAVGGTWYSESSFSGLSRVRPA